MEERKFYVYIYLDSRKCGKFKYGEYVFKHKPFYIGRGQNNRIKDHLNEWRRSIKNKGVIDNEEYNSYKIRTIDKIIKNGKKPIIFKLKENLTNFEANKFERYMVKLIGRNDKKLGPLTNLTDGGDTNAGYTHSEKSKQKMSRNRKLTYKDKSYPEKLKKEQSIRMSKESNSAYKKVDDDLIIDLNNKGKTTKEISEITGISRSIIYRRYKWYNLKPNIFSTKIKLNADLIHNYVIQGLFYKEIAKIMGVSENAISRFYRKSKYYEKDRRFVNKKIIIDCDGVLCHFLKIFYEEMEKINYKINKNKLNSWNLVDKFYPIKERNIEKDYIKILNNIDFWANLTVFENSVNIIKKLNKKYRIVIITSPLPQVIDAFKRGRLLWLKKHFSFLTKSQIKFREDKWNINADIIIEDKKETIEKFDGMKIVMDAPYNQNINVEHIRVNNWKEIEEILL